jgi:hypothetical protein
MTQRKIQDYAMVDGNPHDSFEGLVEIYFQLKGYITSSNKNFWVFDKDKKAQRGYQDIDILAVKDDETVIVSVSSNLDDKVNTRRVKSSTREHFERVERYLKAVKDYRWLVRKKPQRVIAYMSGHKTASSLNKIRKLLDGHQIKLLSVYKISDYLLRRIKTLKDPKKYGLKAENELVRLLQVWLKVEDHYSKETRPGQFIPEREKEAEE